MTAFNPENGPARIIRWVEVMPLKNIVSLFFKQGNLLLIHKEHFDSLDWLDQHRVLRTEEPELTIEYRPNKPPRVRSK